MHKRKYYSCYKCHKTQLHLLSPTKLVVTGDMAIGEKSYCQVWCNNRKLYKIGQYLPKRAPSSAGNNTGLLHVPGLLLCTDAVCKLHLQQNQLGLASRQLQRYTLRMFYLSAMWLCYALINLVS